MDAHRPASPLSAPKAASAIKCVSTPTKLPVQTRPEPFFVERLGADGDGAAVDGAGRSAWIAYTLSGETVMAQRSGARALLDSILIQSAERVAAPCAHYGRCGGCSLQHWQAAPLSAWKSALLAQALERAGYTTEAMRPLVFTPPGRRRRVDLAFRRVREGFRLGLHARQSDEVVDITACQVLDPRLVGLFDGLRALLPRLRAVRRAGSAVFNLLDSGPDLLLRTDAPITAGDRTLLSDLARAEGLCRISHAQGDATPEPACLLRPPVVSFSGHLVSPPPGAFLQASPEGEAAIVAAVLAALPEKLPGRARIAELYAGCGTLSFALSARARVRAWEGSAAAVATLRSPRIEASVRDLARQPLQPAELKEYAAVVLDPPWAGAAAQMPGIAASGVERVIYVSCNPGALARDAALLRVAGYRVVAATPIDQFLWSARLESVVAFSRK